MFQVKKRSDIKKKLSMFQVKKRSDIKKNALTNNLRSHKQKQII